MAVEAKEVETARQELPGLKELTIISDFEGLTGSTFPVAGDLSSAVFLTSPPTYVGFLEPEVITAPKLVHKTRRQALMRVTLKGTRIFDSYVVPIAITAIEVETSRQVDPGLKEMTITSDFEGALAAVFPAIGSTATQVLTGFVAGDHTGYFNPEVVGTPKVVHKTKLRSLVRVTLKGSRHYA